MKRVSLFASMFLLVSPFAGKAGIVYDVSRTVGPGTVTGFIATDGNTGVLTAGDLVDWNLVVTVGSAMVTLTGPLSGNNSVNLLGGSDLTATTTNLLFNFSAVDQGFVLFQQPPVGSGFHYYCDAASNQNFYCSPGEDLVPQSVFVSSYDPSGPLSGNQVIGRVRGATTVPEPAGVLLLGPALLGLGYSARRRITGRR